MFPARPQHTDAPSSRHDQIERERLASVMDEIIKACDGASGNEAGSIGSNALKLQLAAAFLRCIKSGERDLDRLKAMAVDNVLNESSAGAGRAA